MTECVTVTHVVRVVHAGATGALVASHAILGSCFAGLLRVAGPCLDLVVIMMRRLMVARIVASDSACRAWDLVLGHLHRVFHLLVVVSGRD